MKILLVRPHRRKQSITLGEFMFSEPIGLECAAAVLKDKHQVEILDLMAVEEDLALYCRSFQPDVVGFTSLCVDVNGVKELAGIVKDVDPRIVTLVGGTQTFLTPADFFCDSIDHVVSVMSGEKLLELLEYLEQGEELPRIDGIYSCEHGFSGTPANGYNEYIIPDRSSTRKYRKYYSYFGYHPCALLQTSQGCSMKCTFCLRWIIEGSREKDVPLDIIIGQIAAIEEDSIMIMDNDFLNNGERLDAFVDGLQAASLRKNFICYGSVESIIKNMPQIKRFGDAGLRAVLVGYETFNPEELASYHKKATVQDNLEAARFLRQAGIACWASFILHPDWSVQDFSRLRRYIFKLRPEISSLTPFTPMRGGLLYNKYQDRLLFSPDDYDRWSFSEVSVQPSGMSLRRYYLEVLLSNLYVNLLINKPGYMISKFGWKTIFRLMRGSIRIMIKYSRLMLKG